MIVVEGWRVLTGTLFFYLIYMNIFKEIYNLEKTYLKEAWIPGLTVVFLFSGLFGFLDYLNASIGASQDCKIPLEELYIGFSSRFITLFIITIILPVMLFPFWVVLKRIFLTLFNLLPSIKINTSIGNRLELLLLKLSKWEYLNKSIITLVLLFGLTIVGLLFYGIYSEIFIESKC